MKPLKHSPLAVLFAVVWLIPAAGAGCQAIIGATPVYRCTSNEGCPTNLACATGSGACIERCNANACALQGSLCSLETQRCESADAGVADARMDATETAALKPYGLGQRCAGDSDCSSNLCADVRHLAAGIYAKTENVCSKTCCNSADCDPGFFCHGSDKGGRYCISKEKVGRDSSVTAAASGGEACSKNADCRSGLCTGLRCSDTCCKENVRDPNQCKGGSLCRFAPLDGVRTWNCLSGAGAATGASCVLDSDCASNYCISSLCRAPCSGDSSCVAGSCRYAFAARDIEQPLFCAASSSTAVGNACSDDLECVSALCEKQKCTAVCITDADCPRTPVPQKCRPNNLRSPPLLRCVLGP
jgi:hypothetical protein